MTRIWNIRLREDFPSVEQLDRLMELATKEQRRADELTCLLEDFLTAARSESLAEFWANGQFWIDEITDTLKGVA